MCEKEIKIDILLNQTLDYIQERLVNSTSRKEDQLADVLLKIFETKIFAIHKLNFIQYLPLFIISMTKTNEKCKVFT
jgi:hypothetical protein